MILLRVDDVCRGPDDPPEHGTDGDLTYFARWREAGGWRGLPIVYGVVVDWLTEKGEAWLREDLEGSEELAVHGTSHIRGTQPTAHELFSARRKLDSLRIRREPDWVWCRSYIPPFHDYNDETIRAWGRAGGRVFFGGFYEPCLCRPRFYITHEHQCNRADVRSISSSFISEKFSGGLVYIPACQDLYGTSKEVLKVLHSKDWWKGPTPYVLTLHVPWDHCYFGLLREIRDIVEDHLITVDELIAYVGEP